MVMTTAATTLTQAQFIPQYPNQDPSPNLKTKDTGKVLAKALTHTMEFVDPDKQESLRISVKEPYQFNGSDQWKLRRFLL